MKNRHGLKRRIPSGIKRKIRQRYGFGCVICGLGLVEYEHVDPEFKDAKKHDPNAIALLCPQCHSRVTTKKLSKEKVKKAMDNPKCLNQGYTREFFDFAEHKPGIIIGGASLKNCNTPIEICGKPLFSIKEGDTADEPFKLSGTFTDSQGRISLEIIDNEWRAHNNLWDVEYKGPYLTIREKHKKIHLSLKISQPDELVVEALDMRIFAYHIIASKDDFQIRADDGGFLSLGGTCLEDNNVGISLN